MTSSYKPIAHDIKTSRIVPGRCPNCGGALLSDRDTDGDNTRCVMCGRTPGELSKQVKKAVQRKLEHAIRAGANFGKGGGPVVTTEERRAKRLENEAQRRKAEGRKAAG